MSTIVIIALFGLCIGSFLNVCIYRVPNRSSVVFPSRSYCPACNRQLTWWENIPVLSYLFLSGKCRTCKKNISFVYPLVEILSSAAALACYFRFGYTLTALVLYAFIAALITISFIDFEHKIIPDVISKPGAILGCLLGILAQYTDIISKPLTTGALDTVLGYALGYGFFWVIGEVYILIRKEEGLGFGDIKLTGMIGAILGVESILPTIFAASIVGAAVGIMVMFLQRSGLKTEIPFGPYLALGAIAYLFTDSPFLRMHLY